MGEILERKRPRKGQARHAQKPASKPDRTKIRVQVLDSQIWEVGSGDAEKVPVDAR